MNLESNQFNRKKCAWGSQKCPLNSTALSKNGSETGEGNKGRGAGKTGHRICLLLLSSI